MARLGSCVDLKGCDSETGIENVVSTVINSDLS